MSLITPDYSSISSLSSLSPLSPISPLAPLSSVLINTPIILTATSDSIALSDTSDNAPYVTSLNIGYSQPLIGIYDNLNADPAVHKRMTKYYYHKILEKWLYEDLSEVLSYLKVKDGKIDVIDKLSDYHHGSQATDSEAIREKKIDFIEEFFLTQSFVHRVISEFVATTPANWYDLYKHEYLLISIFKKKLVNRVKKAITEKEQISK
jgi:hypothetical protein